MPVHTSQHCLLSHPVYVSDSFIYIIHSPVSADIKQRAVMHGPVYYELAAHPVANHAHEQKHEQGVMSVRMLVAPSQTLPFAQSSLPQTQSLSCTVQIPYIPLHLYTCLDRFTSAMDADYTWSAASNDPCSLTHLPSLATATWKYAGPLSVIGGHQSRTSTTLLCKHSQDLATTPAEVTAIKSILKHRHVQLHVPVHVYIQL